MKKFVLGFFLIGGIIFSGCSSDDNLADGSISPNGGNGKAIVITNSGVERIPLVVEKGTKAVKLVYTSGGAKKSFTAKFTETSSAGNSSMVGGYATVYSKMPMVVDVYDGNNLVAENLQLKGRQAKMANATPAQGTEREAYFFIRTDGKIPGFSAESSLKYYPQNADGTTHAGDINRGKIETDLGKIGIKELHWTYPNGGDIIRYLFSSDGSAVAPVILEEPDITKIKLDGKDIDTTKYKVVWYVAKEQTNSANHPWHVDGVLVEKSNNGPVVDKDTADVVIPTPPENPDNVSKTEDGIYHDGGVMEYDCDGDKDYNDLVVDYDVEARFPKDDNFPYIKIAMHLRALSGCSSIDSVSLDFKDLDKYVCPNDDMNITFQGIAIDKTPNYDSDPQYNIPDFKDCALKPFVDGNLSVGVGNLQWLVNNGNKNGWYKLDENGWYNVTQESFNGKPFATLSVMLYPKSDMTDADIEQAVANILDVTRKSFKFNGRDGDYIIAPVGTPHVVQGYTFKEAFPNYPNEGWWKNDDEKQNFDPEKVVDINKKYDIVK